jgi:hypothetical protein
LPRRNACGISLFLIEPLPPFPERTDFVIHCAAAAGTWTAICGHRSLPDRL